MQEQTVKHAAQDARKQGSAGYVYVIECSKRSVVKIGKSIRPEKRVKDLLSQAGINEDESRVYISSPHYGYSETELESHQALEGKRINGEWFEVSFEEAVSIVERAVSEKMICDEDYLNLVVEGRIKDEGELNLLRFNIENSSYKTQVSSCVSSIIDPDLIISSGILSLLGVSKEESEIIKSKFLAIDSCKDFVDDAKIILKSAIIMNHIIDR